MSQALGTKVSQGQGEDANLSDSRTCTWNTPKFGSDCSCATDVVSVVLEVVSPPAALKERFPTANAYYGFELQTKKQA